MTLSQAQRLFTYLLSHLIRFAYEQGYELTLGEAWRTPEQQRWYVDRGQSQTMKSPHGLRLAIDFNLFRDDVYLAKTEDHRPLGDFWKSLDPRCVWGGDWGWDGNHYEFDPTGAGVTSPPRASV